MHRAGATSSCRVQASHAVASLAAEHGLWGPQASVAVGHRLRCPLDMACGVFPDQDWTLCPVIGKRLLNHWTTRESPVRSSSTRRGLSYPPSK